MEGIKPVTKHGWIARDAPVRRPRTQIQIGMDVLGGSWGGIIGIRAKTDAIVEILEPIEHRNSAGNASGTRTRGTWDLTIEFIGVSTSDDVPFGS